MKLVPPIEYETTTDKSRLDIEWIHRSLCQEAYWARGRSLQIVKASIDHSLCFGVYLGGEQVGFARVVTDYATFAWLCDVFIAPSHRGRGLGKRLVKAVVEHPVLKDLRLMVLATRDAQELYKTWGGFSVLGAPERWMIRRPHTEPSECAR